MINDSPEKSFKKKVVGGVRWSTLHMLVRSVLQVTQLAILARFLTPHDFGLIAIVLIVYSITRSCSEVGISQAIIHKQELNNDQLSSLFWINYILGVTVFLAVLVAAPLIGKLYDSDTLGGLIVVSSLAFLFLPLGVQYRALFERDLNFKITSKIDMATGTIGFVITVLLAINNFGVYSVVIGNLVNICCAALLMFWKGRHYHRPKLYLKISEVKDVLSFGIYSLATKLMNVFNAELDGMIIGKMLGVEALGLYSVAKRLIRQPSNFVEPLSTKISFSVMAKYQKDKESLGRAYLYLVNAICTFNVPVYVFMFFTSSSIVDIFLGSKWTEVDALIKIFCVWGLFRTLSIAERPLILATGKIKAKFIRSVIYAALLSGVISAGTFYGILGVSWAFTLLTVAGFFVNWYVFPRKLTGTTFLDFLLAMSRPALIALAACMIPYLLVYRVFPVGDLPFMVTTVIFISLYLCGLKMFSPQIFIDATGVLGRKKARASEA